MEQLPVAQSRIEELLHAIIRKQTTGLPTPQSRVETLLHHIAVNECLGSDNDNEDGSIIEVKPIHYEGREIVATHTVAQPIESAFMMGETLVNVVKGGGREVSFTVGDRLSYEVIGLEPNTTYTQIITVEGITEGVQLRFYYRKNDNTTVYLPGAHLGDNGIHARTFTTVSDPKATDQTISINSPSTSSQGTARLKNLMIIKGDWTQAPLPFDGYFEGLCSVKMPVLTITDHESKVMDGTTLRIEGEYGSVGEVKDTVNLVTGEVVQRTGLREYQEGDESNLDVMTDMTHTRYKLSEPLIQSIDLKGQQVHSYDGTTYYVCGTESEEPSLIPTLSIEVPTHLSALVSHQQQILKQQKGKLKQLETENEQLTLQNEAQDQEIELTQEVINSMLFAPSVRMMSEDKDNDVSALATYLAHQILKGRLPYELVVERYPEFEEEINLILSSEVNKI